MSFKRKNPQPVLGKALAFAGILFYAFTIRAQENGWTTKTPMPTARGYLSTCLVDGKIYAIGGGFNASTGSKDVEVYNPTTDSWTIKNNLPEPRCTQSTCQVNGKIYIIGGGTSPTGTVYSSVYEYDPVSDSWTRKSDMPTGRLALSASVVNGKIYAIGGAKSTANYQAEKTVEEYDPVTDKWENKADMLTARVFLSTAVLEGKIYAVGGAATMFGPVIKTVEAYDPITDTWTQKASLNAARGWLTASASNGNIYAMAGASAANTNPNIPSIELYNPMSDEWTIIDSIPTARRALCSSAVDSIIYIIGGITGGWSNQSQASDKVEAYTPQFVTSVASIGAKKPTFCVLYQNYPNPFNPFTTISFQLPKNSFASLKIVNILGEQVAELVSQNLQSGTYQYIWQATELPSGLYFYRLEANHFSQTRRMLLMK